MDVQDAAGHWYEGVILKVRVGRRYPFSATLLTCGGTVPRAPFQIHDTAAAAYVHYMGFQSQWDEWFTVADVSAQARRVHTKPRAEPRRTRRTRRIHPHSHKHIYCAISLECAFSLSQLKAKRMAAYHAFTQAGVQYFNTAAKRGVDACDTPAGLKKTITYSHLN